MQKIFALREGVAFRLSYAKIKAWQALDFNMIKEVIMALVLALVFAILGSIAEYKYDLIYNWVESNTIVNE